MRKRVLAVRFAYIQADEGLLVRFPFSFAGRRTVLQCVYLRSGGPLCRSVDEEVAPEVEIPLW